MEQNKEDISVSLIRVAMGAIEERINLELPKIIDNIQDLNTNAKKKRTMTIVIDFTSNSDRNQYGMETTVKSKLEHTNSIQTNLAAYFDPETGEQIVVELVPNIPGQFDMSGKEQEPPKVIKMIRQA